MQKNIEAEVVAFKRIYVGTTFTDSLENRFIGGYSMNTSMSTHIRGAMNIFWITTVSLSKKFLSD